MRGEASTIQPIIPKPSSRARDHDLTTATGGGSVWNMCDWPLYHIYYGDSSARSGWIGSNQKSQMEVRLDGPGTVTFYWKVSSLEDYHWLEVYLDGVLQDRISGEVGWHQKSYNISGSGTHSLMWQYSRDGRDPDGSDRGWVDYLQWTPSAGGGGSSTTTWEQITYTYDPTGRRIAKNVDGEVTKYLYDGDHCIAEYDGDDTLLRKFIHGPGIDQPICMIEVADANAAYFYHYDALGSVVALSDASGDTVQVYEYDVYGQVAASDPNHTNPFLFTGRRFDSETGLYYYRARYYNPTIGRFLQTDPIGYEEGMNLYRYCGNEPLGHVDPSGRETTYTREAPEDPCWGEATGRIMVLPYLLDPGKLAASKSLARYLKWVNRLVKWKGTAGIAINIFRREYGKAIADYFDPVGNLVGTYLDFMETMAVHGVGIAANNRNLWRPFIEVQWYKCKTVLDPDSEYYGWYILEDGEYVEEKLGGLKWVEVMGLLPNIPSPYGYVDAGGYWKGEEAYGAALFGVRYYEHWTRNGHSLPKGAIVDTEYVGPYFSGEFIYKGDPPIFSWLP